MKRPSRIVIVGGGTAGWMAANLLVKQWGESSTITLVESPAIGTIGVGEGSTPTLRRFFELIDVPDTDWMPRCQATYKVGIRFDDWSPASGVASYRHPFFSQPDTHVHRAFLTNCRTRRLGLDVRTQPDDFFLNGALAARQLAPLTPENFPFHVDYGYHFDAGLLGEFLAELGVQRGVTHRQAKIAEVQQNERGDIVSLQTDDGALIGGDFFIDCTGFASVLIQKSLGVAFESFGDTLFNDAAVALPSERETPLPSETVSRALSNGWCWHIPLRHRTGNGYVYSSAHLEPDQAETELRTLLGLLDADVEARHLRMRVGQLEKHWHRNCLALGLSQGFIEPLEATALLLVQVTVERFMALYDAAPSTEAQQATFNAELRMRFAGVRDYITAHYKLNTRDDTDYWRENRDNTKLSAPLIELLNQWYDREPIDPSIERHYATSHFGSLSWHCLLAGYGAFPSLAADQPGRGDLYEEQGVELFVAGCALNFHDHEAALAAATD